jgi:hypothetical protein
LRPKAGGVSHLGREAHPNAPEGERAPREEAAKKPRRSREEAAKIAILKSITSETFV